MTATEIRQNGVEVMRAIKDGCTTDSPTEVIAVTIAAASVLPFLVEITAQLATLNTTLSSIVRPDSDGESPTLMVQAVTFEG